MALPSSLFFPYIFRDYMEISPEFLRRCPDGASIPSRDFSLRRDEPVGSLRVPRAARVQNPRDFLLEFDQGRVTGNRTRVARRFRIS